MCCPYIPPRAFLSQRRADFAPKLRPSFSAYARELCRSENSPARTDGPLSSGRVAGDSGRGYHLFARVLYRAIAKEHIRARHRHSLEHIRTRLAAPQFVLSHLQTDYLETEQEKVEFSHLNYGIEPTQLPMKVLPRTRQLPRHHAVFRGEFPVFLTQDPDRYEPLVTFNFLDPGTSVRSPFPTHLE